MQPIEQQTEQRRGHGRPWLPGQSGNPMGRSRAEKLARRDALIAEWTAVIGGPASLTAAELTLLHQAAGLVMCHPRTAEDRVRCVNLVSRIMNQVGLVGGRKHGPEHVPLRDRIGGA